MICQRYLKRSMKYGGYWMLSMAVSTCPRSGRQMEEGILLAWKPKANGMGSCCHCRQQPAHISLELPWSESGSLMLLCPCIARAGRQADDTLCALHGSMWMWWGKGQNGCRPIHPGASLGIVTNWVYGSECQGNHKGVTNSNIQRSSFGKWDDKVAWWGLSQIPQSPAQQQKWQRQ